MANAPRYRLEDLRRWASALATSAGVPPAKGSALAARLLWFETAGAARFGIAALPEILRGIASREIDPSAGESIVTERGAVALLDGRRGVPLLVLDRAAEIAGEKARETGVGLVRVANVGKVGSGACFASELAVGPNLGMVLGPEGARAVALPSEEGLPLLHDRSLAELPPVAAKGKGVADALAPLVAILAPDAGWLVAAISVVALEPLSSFQRRVAEAMGKLGPADGRLLPGPWEGRRREAQAKGLVIAPASLKELKEWSRKMGVETPSPWTGAQGRSSS